MLLSESLLDEKQVVKSIELFARKKLLKYSNKNEAQEYLALLKDRETEASSIKRKLLDPRFTLSPAQQTLFHTPKKTRIGYKFAPTDEIILFHCARMLQQVLIPKLQNTVFGFARGRGAVSALRASVAHIQSTQDIPLYCIRADIENFGESINSTELRKSLTPLLLNDEIAQNIYKNISTFSYRDMHQTIVQGSGLPTGNFWQLVAEHALLLELDEKLSNNEKHFYARYGDDILVITEEHADAWEKLNLIDSWLTSKGLKLNYKKTRLIKLSATAPWKKVNNINLTSKDLHQLVSTESSFGYLGFQIQRNGQIMLTSEFRQRVKSILEIRLKTVAFAHKKLAPLSNLSIEERIVLLGKALLHLIKEKSSEASIVRFALYAPVSNQEICTLDRWLMARIVSLALLKKPNKAHWQTYSRAKLRALGVPSLLHGSRTRFREGC